MDPIPLIKACAGAVLTLLIVAVVGRLVLRKVSPQRQSTIIPLALAAGFFLGFALRFDLPAFAQPRLWQTPLYAAVIVGVAVALTFLLDFFPASLFLTVASIVAACIVSQRTIPAGSAAFAPWLSLLLTIGGAVFFWVVLQPLATRGKPALLVPMVLLLATASLAFSIFYAIDVTAGSFSALIAMTVSMLAACCVLAVIPFTSHFVRATPAFFITLLFLFALLASCYNPTTENKDPAKIIPAYVFYLPSLALLPALIGYLPFVGKRWWFSLPITFLGSALLAAIPVYFTYSIAPNPFK